IVLIKPNPEKAKRVSDRKKWRAFLRDLYTQRRKNLRGALSGWPGGRREKKDVDARLAAAGFDGSARAETLSVEDHLRLWAGVAAPGTPAKDVRFTPRHLVRTPLRLGWRLVTAIYLRATFDRRYVDLYHEPNYFPLRTRLPTVVTVHDLSAVLHPEWHPADRIALYQSAFLPHVREFTHILTVSDTAREEILRTFNLAPERVTRAYNGVREWLRPLPSSD